MPDELRDPGRDVDAEGVVVHGGGVVPGQSVGVCGESEEHGGKGGAGDGLEQDVESAVEEGNEEGEVGWEGVKDGDFAVGGRGEDGGCVCELRWDVSGRWRSEGQVRCGVRTRRTNVKRIGRTQIIWIPTLTWTVGQLALRDSSCSVGRCTGL